MGSTLPFAARRTPTCLALAVVVLGVSGLLASQTSLRAVRLIVADGGTSVILSADGPLPLPDVGVLTDPPRIYLDFRDVSPATEGIRVNGNLLIRGVRVAVNQPRPVVTRVVIDLVKPAPHRIEAGRRDAGQLTIVVGIPVGPPGLPAAPVLGTDSAAGAAAARRPSVAEPQEAAARARTPATAPAGAPTGLPPPTQTDAAPARAARSPEFTRAAEPSAVRPAAKDVAEYLRRASPQLERLERLRPVLVSLDALAALSAEQLKEAAEEFESIRRALSALEPPRTVAETHELFREVCVLGAASAAARVAATVSDDSARAWNAAAAAAGAIMLLDRARADLGLAAGARRSRI